MVQRLWNRKWQLSQEERVEIYKYVSMWCSYREIWRRMGVAHTTISREISRNSLDLGRDKTKYDPLKAEKKRQLRRYKANQWHILLRRDHKQRKLLVKELKEKGADRWPDEMVWRVRRELWRKTVSASTFYRFIRNERPELQKYLRYGKKWYRTVGKWTKRKKMYDDVPNISERPIEAENRERIGDWEWDTVVSNRSVKWWLVTLVDRKSRYLLMKKIGNHKAATTRITIECMLKWEQVESITFDNGTEFSEIWQLKTQCYRANPYASYERWTNERTNGLIRKYLPKWVNINKWSDYELQQIENKLNHKPRKILWYRSPYEVYHNTSLTYIH